MRLLWEVRRRGEVARSSPSASSGVIQGVMVALLAAATASLVLRRWRGGRQSECAVHCVLVEQTLFNMLAVRVEPENKPFSGGQSVVRLLLLFSLTVPNHDHTTNRQVGQKLQNASLVSSSFLLFGSSSPSVCSIMWHVELYKFRSPIAAAHTCTRRFSLVSPCKRNHKS